LYIHMCIWGHPRRPRFLSSQVTDLHRYSLNFLPMNYH
jgi:hypothetical protein